MASHPLLDPSSPFTVEKVQLFEQLVAGLQSRNSQEQIYSNQVLNALQDSGTMWVHVGTIIEHSRDSTAKFFALQILENVISKAWNAIPLEQQNEIKNFIVKQVISACQEASANHYLAKLNQVLVSIVKREWTTTWVDFIPEICQASRTSQSLCENTMHVLKLLSEEIFDNTHSPLSSTKRQQLKEAMYNQFSTIYSLCEWVLKTAMSHPGGVQTSLVKACLDTLETFLDWIPPAHIFAGDLVSILVSHFLDQDLYRQATLECLREISSIQLELSPSDPHYSTFQNAVLGLLTGALDKLNQMLPCKSTDFNLLYLQSHPTAQVGVRDFAQNLVLFLSALLKTHLQLFEGYVLSVQSDASRVLYTALDLSFYYIAGLTEFPDDEVFKIACEFWHWFAHKLCMERLQTGQFLETSLDSTLYRPLLSKVRHILIPKTAKPHEILVSIDDYGNIVRTHLKDTETLALYDLMRETLVFLTNLDPKDMQDIIMLKLRRQMDGTDWSWSGISSLCYAIGSIAGTLSEEQEKGFLVQVIKDLLALCEGKRGKDNKAVIATNVMYVCRQYPRFLLTHWNFLRTVIRKNFEFMHEAHPGIKDMACESFLRICQVCACEYVVLHESTGQREVFLYEMIRLMPETISDLENHQKFVYYEAVGHCLAAVRSEFDLEQHLSASLLLLNQQWQRLYVSISQDASSFYNLEVMRGLAFVLKSWERVAGALGHFFYLHLGKFYSQVSEIYSLSSIFVGNQVMQSGINAIHNSIVIAARSIRKEIINLLRTYVRVCVSNEILTQHFLPSIFEVIITGFVSSPADLRESEVIGLVTEFVLKLKSEMMAQLVTLLGPFMDSILEMIVKDFHTFPEHRTQFFEFLKAVTAHSFEALLQLPQERLKIALDSVLWAAKHHHSAHAEAGLETLLQMITNVEQSGWMLARFYEQFYTYILTEVLVIMTDGAHLANFKHQSIIVQHLFMAVETGLFGGGENPAAYKGQLIGHLTQLLSQSFTNMKSIQIEGLLIAMFNNCTDKDAFKTVVRDFLVNTKEIAADNEALYAEERQRELEIAKAKAEEMRKQVPGLVPSYPHTS
jgi:exportin-1